MTIFTQPEQGPDYQGLFITFEGGDWVGKSTQIKLLADSLAVLEQPLLITREPGGTALGCELRKAIQHGEAIDARTEALLYAADRAHHVHSLVLPHLQQGGIVLGDRYLDSSVAYQGAARQLGAVEIRDLSLWATGGLLPDLTVLLDGDPEVLRTMRSGNTFDRIEKEPLTFHYAVRAQYQQMVAADVMGRFKVFDAEQEILPLHREILTTVIQVLTQRGIITEAQAKHIQPVQVG